MINFRIVTCKVIETLSREFQAMVVIKDDTLTGKKLQDGIQSELEKGNWKYTTKDKVVDSENHKIEFEVLDTTSPSELELLYNASKDVRRTIRIAEKARRDEEEKEKARQRLES